MKRYQKTKYYTIIVCVVVIFFSILIQIKGFSFIEGNCSYFDPITVDLFAFLVAMFLIIEGAYRIREHKNMLFKNQITRVVRVAIGCAITSTHIMQFFYKILNIS